MTHPPDTNRPIATTAPRPAGFTLIELLTVVGIIALLLGVAFPAIRALTRSGAAESGINTINVAVAAARTYATSRRVHKVDLGDGDVSSYSGAAVLFCPSGELRLVESVGAARSDNNFLQKLAAPRYGYDDIPEADYIYLPKNTGVVGIARGGTGSGQLYLFAPPFAIRFDRDGQLIAGVSLSGEVHRLVHYDSNYDDVYLATANAGASREAPYSSDPYNADFWDPTSDSYVSTYSAGPNTGVHPDALKHTLPFEQIETVIGVIVFSKTDFRAADHTFASHASGTGEARRLNDSAATWIQNNGKPVLFSRLTGRMMRE